MAKYGRKEARKIRAAIIGPEGIISASPDLGEPYEPEQAPAGEESQWRPLRGPRRRPAQGHRDESLPRLSLQVWTWGLLRRMPRRVRELEEELGVSTRGARQCLEMLLRAGVGIEKTEEGEYELFYEVPLEVMLVRGKWCLSRPNQLGVSVDELFTCDAQGRTVLRGPVPTPSGFCLNGVGEHDVYRYAELYKEIYTQMTATIIGAGGSKIWNRRPKEPEDLPEEHQRQWRPVWGPAKADMSFEAPKSLTIWAWGLLRTMPRSVIELARELGITPHHAVVVVSDLRKRRIPIQVRADGRYYMLDHSAIRIVWTRDGFRLARRDEKAGRSIDQLTI